MSIPPLAVKRGDVCWRHFGPASEPGSPAKRCPVVVVQADYLNDSQLATTLVVPLTSNVDLAAYSNNVFIPAAISGLPRDSVALTHQVSAVTKASLSYPEARLPSSVVGAILAGIRTVLGD